MTIMKRFYCAALVIAILLIASCKKDNNSSTGQWTFSNVTYKASGATFLKSDSSLDATSDAGKLSVYFPSASIQSGSYLIVNYDSVPLHTGQVYIRFINSETSSYYFSTGTDNVSAVVTVSPAGKIAISIPSVYLEDYANPVPITAQLSAYITQ